jgi:hypothetical protein
LGGGSDESAPAAEDEPAEELPKFAQEFIGKYFLKATGRKSNRTDVSVWDFLENNDVMRNGDVVGSWSVDDNSRIALTFADDAEPPVYLKPRGRTAPISAAHATQGDTWRWELTRLSVEQWQHTTEPLRVFGHDINGGTETLKFYSNGRVNDPLGSITWARQGRNIIIDWGRSKKTTAVLSSDGKSYVGTTTQATGFRKVNLNAKVTGRMIGLDQ